MERISKLEGMVKNIEGLEGAAVQSDKIAPKPGSGDSQPIGKPSAEYSLGTDDNMLPSGDPISTLNGQQHLAKDRRPSKAEEGINPYLGSSFWGALSEEINGLKEVLSGSSDDDEGLDDEQTPISDVSSPGSSQINHFEFVISQSPKIEGPLHPSQHGAFVLCDVFLANVDPVFKVMHAPSLRKYLQGNGTQLDGSPGPSGLEALRFAIFYAATKSMSEGECKYRMGEDKALLLARYRKGTELGLAKAHFITTVELSTLQALTIYLVAVRVNDGSRFMWTLLGLAVRIAQAMGLQYENSLAAFSIFEQEMRRRLWWQLCILDSSASGDRASIPLILASSFDTKLPLQINDADLQIDSPVECPEDPIQFTDMTFCLIGHEMFDAIRQLNYFTPKDAGQSRSATTRDSLEQRKETVIKLRQHIEQKYLHRLNLSYPFQWATRMVADVITATTWLLVYRPLQKRPDRDSSLGTADPDILHLSVEVLERGRQISTDPAASSFRWLAQTYVQWHALAVTCAELCIKVEGPMVERAWMILEPAYQEIAENVADSEKGMLWRPIKKLIKKAREERAKYLQTRSGESQIEIASISTMSAPLLRSEKMSFSFDDPLERIMDGVAISQSEVELSVPVGSTSMPMPFDWDSWYAESTSSGNQNQYSLDTNQEALANWDNFIRGNLSESDGF
ncbi:MAG: hypothetical protein M1814_002049 [Vezdaea aestivalis]|nr:MAG: hypothetical protein M1814_002049 [Vezdaea aestivalis]